MEDIENNQTICNLPRMELMKGMGTLNSQKRPAFYEFKTPPPVVTAREPRKIRLMISA
jgi:hypothetical protein